MSSQASSSGPPPSDTRTASSSGGPSTKDAFNAALRSRNPQNNYIAHLKIWEFVDTPGGADSLAVSATTKKARYLIMAVQRDTGKVTINKAKRNANGTFSIGKDWDLNTLRVVQVNGETSFTLTLARPYSWTTDRPREQYLFLTSLVNVYRKYTRDNEGPRTIGLDDLVPAGRTSSASATRERPRRMESTDSQGSTGSGTSRQQQQQPLSQSPPRSQTPAARLLIPAVNDHPPRSASAEPHVFRQQASPTPPPGQDGDDDDDDDSQRSRSRNGFFDPRSEGRVDALPSSKPPLFASVNRRPTMNRKESAGPVLQTAQQRTEAPGGQPSYSSSPLAQRPMLLPRSDENDETDDPSSLSSVPESASSSASTLVPKPSQVPQVPTIQTPSSGFSSKDKLAQRLARAAAGAASSSGRSTPADGPAYLEPTSASPTSAPSSRPRPPVRKDSESSNSSSLSLPSSVGNARARLSSIEPMQARGGKAYERMLLAGTGLRSIGDEDEEDEEDGNGEQGEQIEILVGQDEEDDIYGGAVVEDASPSKRANRALNGSPPTTRKATTRRKARSATQEPDSDGDDATLVNVEELLEGIDFGAAHKHPGRLGLGAVGLGTGAYSAAPGALLSRAKGQGTADIIEASLLSELEALDSANIHSILNGDDRLLSVLNYVDEALGQLDTIDSLVASFKVSLNSRAEDIDFIESQNRGLQVMNSNWRALEREIEQLRQTVNVPSSEVQTLLDPNFDVVGAIEAKEAAAASLYKAILQAKTGQMEEHAHAGMAATTERLGEYSSISTSFSQTMFSHLDAVFGQLTAALLADPSRKAMLQPPQPRLEPHDPVEAALGIYCGLMLYVKEVEPKGFERISASYLTTASGSYKEEVTRVIGAWKMSIRRPGEEEEAIASFAPETTNSTSSLGMSSLSRAATTRRLGGGGSHALSGRKNRNGSAEGEVSGAEALNYVLLSVIPLILRESLFISDFLHLNSNGLTFADYMDLETYFRRRAAALFGEEQLGERRGGLREMKGAMELIFGFLVGAVGEFIDEVEKKDRFQVVGMLGALDSAIAESEEANNEFLARTLNRLQMKVNASADSFFAAQLKAVTMTTAAKSGTVGSSYAPSFRGRKSGRGGLTQAVRVLPHFVDRLESQLTNTQHLNVRSIVDGFYSQLTTTVIDALLSIKMEATTATGGQDEDKGVMNHHVLLIENMHHLVQEVTKLMVKAPVLSQLISRAEKVYEDSLSAYTHFVLRRPLGKMMDYGDGIDSLLRTTPANEVSLHSAYSKSSFRKLLKEFTSKDVRKQVDALWRRVLKHFDEDENEGFSLSKVSSTSTSGTELMMGAQAEEEERKVVVGKVWRRCEMDFKREFERIGRIGEECYKGAGGLEIRVDEITRLFAR